MRIAVSQFFRSLAWVYFALDLSDIATVTTVGRLVRRPIKLIGSTDFNEWMQAILVLFDRPRFE